MWDCDSMVLVGVRPFFFGGMWGGGMWGGGDGGGSYWVLGGKESVMGGGSGELGSGPCKAMLTTGA
jgi:hypothetical protein